MILSYFEYCKDILIRLIVATLLKMFVLDADLRVAGVLMSQQDYFGPPTRTTSINQLGPLEIHAGLFQMVLN